MKAARRIKVKRKRIAVLVASIDREYQSDFVREALKTAEQHDIDVCVFNCQGYMNVSAATSAAGESAVFDLPGILDFDGFISLRATLADELSAEKVEQLLRKQADKPHISVDVSTEHGVVTRFDDAVSVRELTEHLIHHHGVRRMVYLSGPQNQIVAVTRLNACREAAAKNGVPLKQEDIFEGEWVYESGRKCAQELLKRPEGLPDAIVCGNDDMAFGVAELLTEKGKSIPDDVIVTGFDALREAIARGLTSIRRPVDLAARKAVELLAEWMNGTAPEEKTICLPTYPIYCESCGCERNRAHKRNPRRLMRNEHRKTEDILLQISTFNGSLASAVDEEDAHQKIDQFVTALGIREIYLCVDPALTRSYPENHGDYAYPEEMLLLYGRKDDRLFPIEMMKVNHLVPVMDEKRNDPLELVFCPLYYREINFGYIAMEIGMSAGLALYSVLMILNGALMSLYLQTNLRNYARRLEEMSITDIMTGMLNRRGFMVRSSAALEKAKNEGKYFVLLSADMDSMKMINDRYGHQMGDLAIIRMGKAVRNLEKWNMIPVHISGDEFLAYGVVTNIEEAEKLLSASYDSIREINEKEPWIVKTSASIGMFAAIPQKDDNIDYFLTRADHAMYEEKNRKKSLRDRAGTGTENVRQEPDR